MKRLAALLLCLLWAREYAVNGLAARAETPADLASALQLKYDTVRDFSADFEHVYTGGILRKQLTERGRMLIKKPGKMRWEYIAPEKKTFVSDGVKLYSYIPADKQVVVTSVPQGSQATTPAMFLAGQGNLIRDFTATEVASSGGTSIGARSLKLVPKIPQAEFEFLTLTVDARTLSLRGLESIDAQGGTSRFAFINLKENVGLSDREFIFSIPRGADVITEGPTSSGRNGGASVR